MRIFLGTKRPYRLNIYISWRKLRVEVYSKRIFKILSYIPFLPVFYILSRKESDEWIKELKERGEK